MDKHCVKSRPYRNRPLLLKNQKTDLRDTLVVSGSGYVEILFRKMPTLVFVWFGDEESSCYQRDFLDFDIFTRNSQWVFRIYWNIEGSVRLILWEAALRGWFHALLDRLFR